MNDNENKKECPCAVCSIGRVIDQKLSNVPTHEEVSELFRGLSVGVAYISSLNSNPEHVVRVFLETLQYALNEQNVVSLQTELTSETIPPVNRRH